MNTITKRLPEILCLCGLMLLAACGGDATEEGGVAPVDTSGAAVNAAPPAAAPAAPADTAETAADTAADTAGVQEEEGKVRVEEFQYSLLPGGARVLTGKIYNTTAEPIRNAQIQVSLFDEGNRRVASMSILVRDIPAGEFKTFREPVDTDDDEAVTGARVRGVLVL